MPNNETFENVERRIQARIVVLKTETEQLEKYLVVIEEIKQLSDDSIKLPRNDAPMIIRNNVFTDSAVEVHRPPLHPTPPSSPNKRKYTRKPKEAAVSKTFKPVEEKQCQRCKKTWPADDFEMGEFRPKRVCVHCERTESAPAKKKGRPGKARLVEPPLVPSAALRISPPDSGGQLPSKVAAIRRRPRSGDDPELVYSKPMRCPKCSSPVARFERRADAGPDDMWTCQENDCQLRVGNYNIGVDKSYSGGGAAA